MAVVNLARQAAAVRCAIYTRKSTDEGLDSDFNTLDAQRESAEAYIASQRHEGWMALPQKYDDGGFTGANMERPALQRLLSDIRDGLVNCVVVYKVDRLTRSLLDFAKIMEVFDQHGISFVSVTQQFNTAASLGRLTLNVLMSFAQFEREMIAERTRDKMSAARRKGKWVGGNPVLGYDVHPNGGALVVNEEEAARVQAIFALYLELGSLLPVVDEIGRRGWTLKRWTTRDGKIAGGKAFTRPRLHQLLTNIIYTGRIRHRGEIFAGEHEAIIDTATWDKVQARLKDNAPRSTRTLRNKYGALLKGIVHCASCDVGMVHTYTQKDGRIYRYYICVKAHQRGWNQCVTRSVSAPELEQAVVDQIRGVGRNPMMLTAVMEHLEETGFGDVPREDVARALREFDGLWRQLSPREQEQLIKALVETVSYDGQTGTVTVSFRSAGIKQLCLLQEA
jgi:site-specific DNA recombinase